MRALVALGLVAASAAYVVTQAITGAVCAPFSSAPYSVTVSNDSNQIIPADRITTWRPGITCNGKIPNRTTIYKTIYKTLFPLGGTQDDTRRINVALANCPANQVVKLTAGVFRTNGNGLGFRAPNCTLRGVGPGKGLGTVPMLLVLREPSSSTRLRRNLSRPIAALIRTMPSSTSAIIQLSFLLRSISPLIPFRGAMY